MISIIYEVSISGLSEFWRSFGQNISLQFLICIPRKSDKTQTKSQTGSQETQELGVLWMFLFVSVSCTRHYSIDFSRYVVASTVECHHFLYKWKLLKRKSESNQQGQHSSFQHQQQVLLDAVVNNVLQQMTGAWRNIVFQGWGTFIATWPGHPLGERHCRDVPSDGDLNPDDINVLLSASSPNGCRHIRWDSIN